MSSSNLGILALYAHHDRLNDQLVFQRAHKQTGKLDEISDASKYIDSDASHLGIHSQSSEDVAQSIGTPSQTARSKVAKVARTHPRFKKQIDEHHRKASACCNQPDVARCTQFNK